ncbi:methyltransferase [Streptomyces chartreusis]|uniref:methyltransferase n=1 Tax=Streptomyces chartreusis TaxID=1969 RepID=UPI0036BD78B5
MAAIRPVQAAEDPSDRGRLAHLVFGHMAAQVVATATRFGLMDLIGDQERPATELAEECGADRHATVRLLRALASLELLVETTPGSFSLTPTGDLLRTDRPDSFSPFVQMFTDPALTRAWGQLDMSVRTGRPSFDSVIGKDYFTHLKDNPGLSAQFNAAMSQITRASADGVSAAYDFGRFDKIVDVGGGDGTLLAVILREHESARGIVFDTAEGLAQAQQTLKREGVDDRCTLHVGDFFHSVPVGGDLYLLKSVIHDWDDERAVTILRHCREVMPEHGRLLIVEPLLPPTVESTNYSTYLIDLNMLISLGGQERTHANFEDLCTRSSFTLNSVTQLPSPQTFFLIEATPA